MLFLIFLKLFGILFRVTKSEFTERQINVQIAEDDSPGTILVKLDLNPEWSYRLLGDTRNVQLNSVTGEIALLSPIDRESLNTSSSSFHLVIVSTPPSIITVHVEVKDVNDNAPSFALPFQNLSLVETAPIGSSLPLLSATDPDFGLNGTITEYKIVNSNPGPFELRRNEELLLLELTEPLDREQTQLYIFNISAKDGGDPPRFGYTTVFVDVLDANDNAPSFGVAHELNVTWNGRRNSTILKLNATDEDTGQNAHITYSVLSSNSAKYFKIEDGLLKAKQDNPPCCRSPSSHCSECVVAIEAKDDGSPPLASSLVVRIHIPEHYNAHDPQIHIRVHPSEVDFAVVEKDAISGKTLAVLTVTDEDGDIGDQSFVNISSGNESGLFELVQQTQFAMFKLLDEKKATKEMYEVEFEASDGQRSERKSRKTLKVFIERLSTTRFVHVDRYQSVAIKQSLSPGSFVAQIRTNNSNCRFRLRTENTPFEMDDINGIITISDNKKDLEANNYELDVEVRPPPPLIDLISATVSISVQPSNILDNRVPNENAIVITDKTPLGMEFMKLNKMTNESNFTTTCLTLGADSNGVVFLKDNRITADHEQCQVKSINEKMPAITRTIDVRKETSGESLHLKRSYMFSISEAAPMGTVIGSIHETGNQENSFENFYRFWTTSNTSIGVFANGVVYVRRPISRSPSDVIKASVMAVHRTLGNVQTTTVTVLVKRENLHSPICDTSSDGRVPVFVLREDSPIFTSIGRVTGFDADVGSSRQGVVVYRLINAIDSIHLSPISGNIYSLSRFRHYDTPYFNFTYEISDAGNPPKKALCNATIEILPDTRIAPKFDREFYTAEMDLYVLSGGNKSRGGNVPLLNVTAGIDRKFEANVTYSLLNHKEDFLMDEVSGQLFAIRNRLNRLEHDSIYNLSICARNHVKAAQSKLKTCTFALVRILPDKTIKPKFTECNPIRVSIYETPASIVGKVRATAGRAMINYEIASKSNLIDIDFRGRLFLRSFPPSNISSLDLLINAKTEFYQTAGCLMRVEFVNDVKRNSRVEEVQIMENKENIVLEHIDDSFKLTLVVPKTDTFKLISGNLFLSGKLDREQQGEYWLLLESDREKKVVHVTVEDENDNAPRCGQTDFLLRTLPAEIHFNCWDADRNTTLVFFMEPNGHAEMSPDGVLLIRSLRDEAVTQFDVRVSDGRDDEADAKSTAIVLNVILEKGTTDHVVHFYRPQIAMLLSSSQAEHASFGRVTADSALPIRYFLIGSHDFRINEATGEIYAKRRIPAGTTPMATVLAVVEAGGQQHLATSQIEVQVVEDVLHLDQTQFFFASTQISSGQLVGLLPIDDKVQLELNDPFFFIDSQRRLIAKRHLEMQSNSSFYTMKCEAVKGKLKEEIEIFVVLLGDQQYFDSSEDRLVLWLPENAPRGTVVGSMNQGDLLCSFSGDSMKLSIDDSGSIKSREMMDFEEGGVHEGKLECRNGKTRNVTLLIEDQNDNPPEFDKVTWQIDVREDALAGEILLKLRWTDKDKENHFFLEIESGNERDEFRLDENGNLVLKRELSWTRTRKYELKIVLQDGRPPEKYHLSHTTVKITVIPVLSNCHPSITSPSQFAVYENAPLEKLVGRVEANDCDFEEVPLFIDLPPLHYRILPESLPYAEFTIDPIHGYIMVNSRLDYERQKMYNFTVVAFDPLGEKKEARQTVEIFVIDENDHAPKFEIENERIEISENIKFGSAIYRVQIGDDDTQESNRLCLFELVDSAEDTSNSVSPSAIFRIGPTSGIIYVAGQLDFEMQQHYNLTIRARNLVGGPTLTRSLQISIVDENDEPPRFISGSPVHFSVYENLPLPHPVIVGLTVAEDSDANHQLTYGILSGNTSLFTVNSTTGSILALQPLDREEKEQHKLTVQAIDTSFPRMSSISDVVITVLDINDNAPEFNRPRYIFNVPEDAQIGTLVGQVQAEDRDAGDNGKITYRLPVEIVPFSVNPITGEIRVAGQLDREKVEKYELSITAEDSGRFIEHSSSTTLSIIITDVNDNTPVIVNEIYDVYIRDDIEAGDVVHVVEVTDPDEHENLQYSLIGPDSSLFHVTNNGEIISKLPLSKMPFYSVGVFVYDKGQRNTSASFTFYMKENQYFPTYLSAPSNAKTTEGVEREIAKFIAKSKKRGDKGKIKYSILRGNQNREFMISESRGILKATSALDREMAPIRRLWIEASDGDYPPLSVLTPIDIIVEDANDNDPEFEKVLYKGEIVENSEPVGILRVKAIDMDAGDNANIRYSILNGNEGNEFEIKSNGEIWSTRELDRETKTEYRLAVVAEDGGKKQRKGETVVVVKILDEDDNPPRFTNIFNSNVKEDIPIGSTILTITATDPDEASNHSFAIISDNSDDETKQQLPFVIDAKTGQIVLMHKLDYEKKTSYHLKIKVEDGNWEVQSRAVISVLDVNDNRPEFSSPQYNFKMSSFDPTQNVTIGKVEALDADGKEFGQITYLIEDNPYLTVDADTGELRLISAPRHRGNLFVNVTAIDTNNPLFFDTATVSLAFEIDKSRKVRKRSDRSRSRRETNDLTNIGINDNTILKRHDVEVKEEDYGSGDSEDKTTNTTISVTLSAHSEAGTIVFESRRNLMMKNSEDFAINGKRLELWRNLLSVDKSNLPSVEMELFEIVDFGERFLVRKQINIKFDPLLAASGVFPSPFFSWDIRRCDATSDSSFVVHSFAPFTLPTNCQLHLITEGREKPFCLSSDGQLRVCGLQPQSSFYSLRFSVECEGKTMSRAEGFIRIEECSANFDKKKPYIGYLRRNSRPPSSVMEIGRLKNPDDYLLINPNHDKEAFTISDGGILKSNVPLNATEKTIYSMKIALREKERTKMRDVLIFIDDALISDDDNNMSVKNSNLSVVIATSKTASLSSSTTDIDIRPVSANILQEYRCQTDELVTSSCFVNMSQFSILESKDLRVYAKKNGSQQVIDYSLKIDKFDVQPDEAVQFAVQISAYGSRFDIANLLKIITPNETILHPIAGFEDYPNHFSVVVELQDSESRSMDAKQAFEAIQRKLTIMEAEISRHVSKPTVRWNFCEKIKCLNDGKCTPVMYWSNSRFSLRGSDVVWSAFNGKIDGRCVCPLTYLGDRCETRRDDVCNAQTCKHGFCDKEGKCQCYKEYEGDNCQNKKFPNVPMRDEKQPIELEESSKDDGTEISHDCAGYSCGSEGQCKQSKGSTPDVYCTCENGIYDAKNCNDAQTSISLRNGTVLQLQPTYFLFSHLEDLHNNSNPLYCNLSQSIQIDFRTKFNGQLTLMQIIRPDLESVVEIINGTLVYSLKGSYRIPIVMRIHSIVNDGEWHRMQLALSSDKKKIRLNVDDSGKEASAFVELPQFLSKDMESIMIGESRQNLQGNGQKPRLMNAGLCVKRIIIQGQLQTWESRGLVHSYFAIDAPANVTSCVADYGIFDGALLKRISIALIRKPIVWISMIILLTVILTTMILVQFLKYRYRNSEKSGVSNGGWSRAKEIDAYAMGPGPGPGGNFKRSFGYTNKAMNTSCDVIPSCTLNSGCIEGYELPYNRKLASSSQPITSSQLSEATTASVDDVNKPSTVADVILDIPRDYSNNNKKLTILQNSDRSVAEYSSKMPTFQRMNNITYF